MCHLGLHMDSVTGCYASPLHPIQPASSGGGGGGGGGGGNSYVAASLAQSSEYSNVSRPQQHLTPTAAAIAAARMQQQQQQQRMLQQQAPQQVSQAVLLQPGMLQPHLLSQPDVPWSAPAADSSVRQVRRFVLYRTSAVAGYACMPLCICRASLA